MQQGWYASATIYGSPVVGGHTIYSFSDGVLYALKMSNGQLITSLNIGAANHFVTPTILGTTLFIGTSAGITAVNIS
jgi:outer membrane protein assembly factor BamB